ncbi:hypothetical protein [Fusobacterium gonidiaformans]|uniref:hypothetical protein n=1 Tax=Fusobacterium gonidiaformans TaxID=849 RepID=UPI0023F0A3D9|nr:hypothetical protein [Fusobacterium gonidiaformans]
MKKWLAWIFYISISCFSFADYFLSNGEVTFYFDDQEKEVSYLRGDALYPLDISRIRFYWIDEKENVYDFQASVKKVEKEGENILAVSYVLDHSEWKITFIPSFQKKNQLFAFLEGNIQQKGYLVMEISPQQENRYIRTEKEEQNLEYENFMISSNRKDFSLYLSKDSSLSEFQLERVLKASKKFREDRLYYIFDKMQEGKQQVAFTFHFYQKEKEEWKTFEELFLEEKAAALFFQQSYEKMRSSKILSKNLEYLDLLSSRVYIPNFLSYAKARMSYLEKQQLLFIRALYHMTENHQRILEDVNLRKKEIDSVHYFYYALLYAEKTQQRIDQNLVNKRLLPQILSIYDEMTEDGRLIAVEDSLEAYASYYRLLSLLEKRIEFSSELEFIQERKQKLYSYIQKAFVQKRAFKDRSFQQTVNIKNIEYLFLLPNFMQKSTLKQWYEKNYDKNLGVIHYFGEKNVDTIHNLKMVSILYEMGMQDEAEQLLRNLEQYMRRSQNYVLEEYSLVDKAEKQEIEISARALYYYLLANWNREQYHGNER